MSIKLQAVLSAWKSFDLNTTQQDLDRIAAEITVKQDESDVSRKKLVEQLKESKKICPEETKKLAPLIKGFQNEVDFLSKRSKFAETAFLKNYQKFLDIIDPIPSLEYSVGLEKKFCLQEELELENKRMKLTIAEYNEELKEVKNQDVTIKALKEKIKNYEEQMRSTLNVKTKELEKKYASLYGEKERLILETQQHTQQKLQEAIDKCQNLQCNLEQCQSELFEVKTKLDDNTEAKSEEIDMLMNDLDRVNHQLSLSQRKVIELEKKNECALSDPKEMENINFDMRAVEMSSLEAEIAHKNKEISQLITDIKDLENALSILKESSSFQVSSLQGELHDAKMALMKYETQLEQMKDYDEVKQELTIIKAIEFSGIESAKPLEDVSSKPLELLLLEKNKSLQNENTTLKLAYDELVLKQEDLEIEFKNVKTLTVEQQTLITQLELDLSSVQSLSNPTQREGPSQVTLISEAVRNISPVTTTEILNSETSSNAETAIATESLLSIVSAQRERFKMRNEELEIDLASQNSQLIAVQTELDSLRADNLRLYEKIRFLQSYEGYKNSAGDSFPESQYSNQYEKSLDPFHSFSQKEKQKRYHSLSPFEKITLSIGQLILRNKSARTAAFIYVSVLHCLIFFVLYRFAYTESYKRDLISDCAQKFAQHMHDVHG